VLGRGIKLKTKILAGNWKMNLKVEEVKAFFDVWNKSSLSNRTGNPNGKRSQDTGVIVFPQAHLLALCLEHGKNVRIGAQNCYSEDTGAFTGELSPESLMSLGLDVCLVGHSERRQYFGETDQFLNLKIKALHRNAMTAMYCVGESLEERESGRTFEVLKEQLHEGLNEISDFSRLIIAYEPVWAIGTGKQASAKQVDEVHSWIDKELTEMLAFRTAKGGMNGQPLQNAQTRSSSSVPILYGGSVKPETAPELASLKNISGFLVGGASLKPTDFEKIGLAIL